MKKILIKIFRIGIVVILLWACLLITLRIIFGPPFREAREYLNYTIPMVVKHWDLNDLRKYAGSCLLKQLDGNDKTAFKSLFEQCATQLGSLKQIEDSKIDERGVFCGSGGCTFMYECSTQAIFEKGTATIITSIYFRRGNGNIESFNVELK